MAIPPEEQRGILEYQNIKERRYDEIIKLLNDILDKRVPQLLRSLTKLSRKDYDPNKPEQLPDFEALVLSTVVEPIPAAVLSAQLPPAFETPKFEPGDVVGYNIYLPVVGSDTGLEWAMITVFRNNIKIASNPPEYLQLSCTVGYIGKDSKGDQMPIVDTDFFTTTRIGDELRESLYTYTLLSSFNKKGTPQIVVIRKNRRGQIARPHFIQLAPPAELTPFWRVTGIDSKYSDFVDDAKGDLSDTAKIVHPIASEVLTETCKEGRGEAATLYRILQEAIRARRRNKALKKGYLYIGESKQTVNHFLAGTVKPSELNLPEPSEYAFPHMPQATRDENIDSYLHDDTEYHIYVILSPQDPESILFRILLIPKLLPIKGTQIISNIRNHTAYEIEVSYGTEPKYPYYQCRLVQAGGNRIPIKDADSNIGLVESLIRTLWKESTYTYSHPLTMWNRPPIDKRSETRATGELVERFEKDLV